MKTGDIWKEPGMSAGPSMIQLRRTHSVRSGARTKYKGTCLSVFLVVESIDRVHRIASHRRHESSGVAMVILRPCGGVGRSIGRGRR
jgi:hypothetical protein